MAGPQNHPKPFLLRRFDIGAQIKVARKVKLARTRLVRIPEHVGADGVQPERARFLHPISPRRARDARIVHLARHDLKRLSIQQQLIAADAKCVRRRRCAGRHRRNGGR
jgi:hypothetical protein